MLEIAGIEGLTKYFHYFGSGHIIWMTRIHGNLWRHRDEGVEGMNGVLSYGIINLTIVEEIRVEVKMGTMSNVRHLRFLDRGCRV